MSDKTILIVDDEERNIKLLKAILALESYNLVGAASGEEALQRIAQSKPDLVLLDVMMPGLDGFEVCRRIRQDENTRGIPVVMITALREKEHRIRAIEAGADDFISKPVDQTEIILRVKSLMRIKTYHDDLLKSYSELEQMNLQLKELEKVKEGLIHMVIHDLNSPLMAISGNIQLVLLDKKDLSEKLVQYMQTSLNHCHDLNQLIQSLLDVHRMEEAKLQIRKEKALVDVMIKESLAQFASRAELKGIHLTFEPLKPIPPAQLDVPLIGRVIANLLSNAIRHTPHGGKVVGTADYLADKGSLLFSIKDTGPGLEPQYHQRVFDKFEQVLINQEGSKAKTIGSGGLGLAFCKMAVEAHGGRIWVESEGKGKGCAFLFELPA